MEDGQTRSFYEELSELYHLVYADWDASIAAQGKILSAIIRDRWEPARRILDAACGIGTQALGLAALGFDVVGSDIAPAALARARREAEKRRLGISFVGADLRELASAHRPGFDVVLACDNAIPHLQTADEILGAFRQARLLLRPGGGLLLSVRDYEAIERSGTHMVPYGVRNLEGERLAIFQLWEFLDERHYVLSMFFIRHIDEEPEVQVFRCRYHAVLIGELEELLAESGFVDVERHQGGFFQPVLVATNP